LRLVSIMARLTILEASRRRLLLALVLLTLVVIGLSSWGFSRIPTMAGVTPSEVRLAASQLTIFVAFMFSGVLALGSTLVASPTISADVESGILLSILPRPIRRIEVLLGKWFGLAFLVAAYAAISGLLELLGIFWATGYVPPNPAGAIAFVAAEGLVLMTLSLLLSTRLAPMTAGIIALVLFFAAWMGGIALGIGQAFHNDTITTIGTASRLLIPTDGLWHGAVFSLEPDFILAIGRGAGRAASGNPFLATGPQPIAYLVWVGVWLLGLLGLSAWSFGQRDL
jgi:ABC-type transport system involved in multi-copper enzyme maturation permease subunit